MGARRYDPRNAESRENEARVRPADRKWSKGCQNNRSLILTSQMPVARWHEQIGDPTVADGILDRLVHNAHRIEMRGDSMRENRGRPGAQ